MERTGLYRFYNSFVAQMGSEKGQALSEYSITLVLLVIVTIAAITALGGSVVDLLQNSVDILQEL